MNYTHLHQIPNANRFSYLYYFVYKQLLHKLHILCTIYNVLLTVTDGKRNLQSVFSSFTICPCERRKTFTERGLVLSFSRASVLFPRFIIVLLSIVAFKLLPFSNVIELFGHMVLSFLRKGRFNSFVGNFSIVVEVVSTLR